LRPQLRLLGAFELLGPKGESIPLPTRKAKALLAYLSAQPRQAQARGKLASLFWEDGGEKQARECLRQTLALLRKAMPLPPEEWLIAQGDNIAFEPSYCDVDVYRFLDYLKRPGGEKGAADIYSGDFLEGLSVPSAEFDAWAAATRQNLRERALACYEKLLGHCSAANDIEQGITVATRLLNLDPLRESVHRQLMDFYQRQGRHNSALRQYQDCVKTLDQELGIEPDAETTALWREIREQRNKARQRDRDTRQGAKPLPQKASYELPSLERRCITVIEARQFV